jgi:transcriptional regulator with XRE-family HTH domain
VPPQRTDPQPEHPTQELDLNQVVAYNVRDARLMRGWTQEQVADRLEPYLGQRISQAAVSSIERAWDGERRREFDAHELLFFSLVFDLPIIWFLLPPPGDDRRMRATGQRVSDLYAYLLGRGDQLEPLYQRLRETGIRDPSAAEQVVENLTGTPSDAREWSYRQRRKEMLLALLDQHADGFDDAIDQLGDIVDQLRQAGIRGFIAETTGNEDFTYREGHPPNQLASEPPSTGEGEAPPDATRGYHEGAGGAE